MAFPESILKLASLAIFVLLGAFLIPGSVQADGCYICKPGSSANCKHYCKFRGDDDWENRKKCQKAGCDIGGTASCPTGANYQVCYVEGPTDSPVDHLAILYNWNFASD
ncbi:MAG: hypothetical protein RH862_02640 [Leptospiraceae bacterium]